MRSVTTNLMTSLDFNPIRCATTLRHFGRTRSSYLDIPFNVRGSTAMSSATGDYVAIPDRFGQNEEPAGSNKERATKKPGLVPKVDLFDAIVF